MASILGVGGERKVVKKRDLSFQTLSPSQIYHLVCDNNPFAAYIDMCNPTTTAPSTTTTDDASSTTQSSSTPFDLEITTSIDNSNTSALERAHWCSFSNGTYLALGYMFLYKPCVICQCAQSRVIRCTTLQCMATYCIDNSSPSVRDGQCCSQCPYEPNATTCMVNGINFPDGTILKVTSDNTECWCQLGTVECRKSTSSAFSSMDLWGQGSAVYVIIVVVAAIVFLGSLLCCGCALFYYFYYKRQQQAIQEAHEQYYNTAGWQPMGDEEQVVDASAEEKQAEAEQNQFEYEHPTGNSQQYIPPPYALYNGAYVTEQTAEKDQKFV